MLVVLRNRGIQVTISNHSFNIYLGLLAIKVANGSSPLRAPAVQGLPCVATLTSSKSIPPPGGLRPYSVLTLVYDIEIGCLCGSETKDGKNDE
ncbi:hypothetical protein Tco_1325422 [Tanacetum coccineum]